MPTLNLSPTARSVILILGVILAAVIPVLVTAGVPVLVTAAAGAIVTALVGLGLVPPQVGGTQKGVVSPQVADTRGQPANVTVEEPVFKQDAEPAVAIKSAAQRASNEGSRKGNDPDPAEPDIGGGTRTSPGAWT